MTAFSRSEAEKNYQELSAEDLADIAYVDPGYLPEAKQVAVAELERRGLAKSKDELVARAKREVVERRELREGADSATMERFQRLREQFGNVALVSMTWLFALIAPFENFWLGESTDWMAVALVFVWIIFVIDAIRKAMRGERLMIYLILVGPLLAMLASQACRMLLRH